MLSEHPGKIASKLLHICHNLNDYVLAALLSYVCQTVFSEKIEQVTRTIAL